MTDRLLKILSCLIVGAMALVYVAHNIANWGPAYDFFVYTTSHRGQEAYPVTLLPVPPPPLIVLAMVLVFAFEFAAGALLLWGCWRMWRARDGAPALFEAAKTPAKLGLGLAIANWWGLFQVIAVAGYQLWQMPNGQGPDHGSWVYGAISMLTLIYLSQAERVAEA